MATVVNSKRQGKTLRDDTLATETVYIVQPDWLILIARTEVGVGNGRESIIEPEIATDHLRVV